jgi:hypothetical protein
MSRLETAKKIIKEHMDTIMWGIFDTRNILGDFTRTVFNENGLTIDICDDWRYFEVFGLTDEEFLELKKFYESLGGI